jgi:hypothetical protein
MSDQRARYGWGSNFPEFHSTASSTIQDRLRGFIPGASIEQLRAWTDYIPPLQREIEEVLVHDILAKHYSAILEYELPMESRRPDVLLLVGDTVIVLELKGKADASQADLDQAAAYARDLSCYHRECWNRPVVPVVVPTRARGYLRQDGRVHVTGPDGIDALVRQLASSASGTVIDRAQFLAQSAYCPLPTLVKAARELFQSGTVRKIHRASASTDPAVEVIRDISYHAAATRTRHLVLLTGVPGAGKTLVGLSTVHAHYLDTLAVPRADGAATTPAVFLSGNGPLVQVLQYELRSAGGGGKTFVRGVKDYIKMYSSRAGRVPPEHVLVFDEAQRAYDATMVSAKHAQHGLVDKSEPQLFIEIAERIPDWCVVVGLIGTGQEIHVGEEAGLAQWRSALERTTRQSEWTVHGPHSVVDTFASCAVPFDLQSALNLETAPRFHFAGSLHQFVNGLLDAQPAHMLSPLAGRFEAEGFHLRLTRSLNEAKEYLRQRYADDRDARFGIVASSRDRVLGTFGVPNDFEATKRVRFGPWYGQAEDEFESQSCRRLDACVTEFGAQGLELEAALLAWGTDLVLNGGRWSNASARTYRQGTLVRDAFQLRINAYRVLLTRGRDGCVVFVPPLAELDETFAYLLAIGFKRLADN